MRRKILLELSQPDDLLLKRIAEALDVPRVQVMRWALRFYAMAGPWPANPVRHRRNVIGYTDHLVCGPQRQEAIP